MLEFVQNIHGVFGTHFFEVCVVKGSVLFPQVGIVFRSCLLAANRADDSRCKEGTTEENHISSLFFVLVVCDLSEKST